MTATTDKTPGTGGYYQIKKDDWEDLNRSLRFVCNRLDALEGRRGNVPMGSNIDLNSQRVINAADPTEDTDYVTKKYADANYGPSQVWNQLIVTGDFPLPPNAIAPGSSIFIEDTHAVRITSSYAPTAYPIGSGFYETDRTVIYLVVLSGGTNVWQYTAGIMTAASASRPADLTVNDAGFRFHATDTTLRTRWTGAAWVEDYELTDAATVTVTTMLLLKHLTSGAAGIGFGAGEVSQLQNAGGTAVTALYRTVEWLIATATAESSIYRLSLMNAGALTEIIKLYNTGHLQLSVATAILRLGGATTSFPGIQRNGAKAQTVLADGSGLTGHEVLDDPYGAGWNADITVPTKNAVYDKIETVTGGESAALVSDAAYGAGWNGVTTIAPSKNAVYDQIQTLLGSSAYTPTNVTTDRSYDADTVIVAELADVVGTLIADLQSKGILS